jgi:hypothetical protein
MAPSFLSSRKPRVTVGVTFSELPNPEECSRTRQAKGVTALVFLSGVHLISLPTKKTKLRQASWL